MYLPAVNYVHTFDDVVVRVLRGRQARVVREHADARAYAQALEERRVFDQDFAVLLRERADARARIAPVQIEHAPEAARRVELDGAAVFRERDRARVEHDLLPRAVAVYDRR